MDDSVFETLRGIKKRGSGLAISHLKKIVGNSLFFTIGKLLGEK